MTKRHYQLFALLLLVGAPLVVSLLTSTFLPGLRQIAPNQPEPQRPDYMQPAPDPEAGLPPAQQETPQGQVVQAGPQAGGSYTPVPPLYPAGVTLAGTDPTPISPLAADAASPGQAGQNPGILSAEDQRAMSDVQP